MTGSPPLRLGTRGSTLARLQSGLVADALRRLGVEVELVTVVTAGDTRPPDTAWGEGAFVGALELALREDRVDLAVHSAKDVPIEPEVALVAAAYPPREDPRDALVGSVGVALAALADLPAGSRVGTDSPRRSGFLRAARPDLVVVPLHGNVDTRLARLDRGEVDALVLAAAGLRRLGRAERISAILEPAVVAPAPGQGALAVQVRAADERTRSLVAGLDDAATRLAVTAERAVLAATGGGCRAPLGALARVVDGDLDLLAAAVEPDGWRFRLERRIAPLTESAALAAAVAEALLAAGPVGAGT
ncbi:MAG TPA: hydroxymethylbilane synthase [Candidatus Limnocylindrales bacterium]